MALGAPATALAQDYMATGTYMGDGTLVRSIEGIGFTPDLVIIKGVKGDHSVARTSTMPPGTSNLLGDGKGLEAKRILSLDGDGFTIDDENAVNENGFPFYWVAMKTESGHLGLGTYTGDGIAFHEITGVGFRPTAVILISDDAKPAILRSDPMPPGMSIPLGSAGQLTDGLLSFRDDGFIVGANDAVNKDGIEMHYIAWPAAESTIVTGNYNGNDGNNRSFSGLGLSPEYLILRSSDNQDGVHRMASVTGDSTLFFKNHNVEANVIKALTPDGFIVGSHASANDAGRNYNWIAFANPPLKTDLRLQMGADNGAPNVGEPVTFDLTLTNLGPADAAGVEVKVPLPAGLAYQSAIPDQGSYDQVTGDWTVGGLPIGVEVHLQLTAIVEAGMGGTTLNIAAVAEAVSPAEADPANNDVSVDIIIPAVDLAVTALVNNSSPDVGSLVVYTLAVTNTGPDQGTGIEVSGFLPAGLAFQSAVPSQGSYNNLTGKWTLGTLDASSTATLTLLARVEPGYGGLSLAVTFAVAAVDQEDPATPNNSHTIFVTVTSCDLGLVKTVDILSPNEGQAVTFQIVATNAGPSDATGVSVSDVLPAGLGFDSATADVGSYDDATGLWTIEDLGGGSSATLDLVAVVAPGTGGQTLNNTAIIGGVDQEDLAPGNDSSSASVTVTSTDLQVDKTVDTAVPNEGDTVTFRVNLTNAGTIDATGVAVTDTLPTGLTFISATPVGGSYNSLSGVWTVGDLAAGASASLQVRALVEAGTAGSTILNHAWISASDLADLVPGNNADSAAITIAGTDLRLQMGADNGTPNVGEMVTFDLTLSNLGPIDAVGTGVNISLPAGLNYQSADPDQGSYNPGTGNWTVGGLPSGAELHLELTATVEAGTGGATLNVAAVASAASPAEVEPTDNNASVDIVVPAADLVVTALVNNASPDAGSTVVYTVAVTNTGPDDGTGIELSGILPMGLAFQSATASLGSYNNLTGMWTLGTLETAMTGTLTLLARVEAGTGGATLAVPFAVTASDQEDPFTADNARTISITVTSCDLSLAKTVDIPSPDEGGLITFRIVATNAGPSHATGVRVGDVLPAGLAFDSATADFGSYNDATGLWTIGDLASGTSANLDLVTVVASGTGGQTLTNTATIDDVDQEDPDSTNDEASTSVTINSTDLQVEKTVDTTSPNEGDTITYTVTVTNVGPNDVTGVAVTDTIPTGLAFVSADPGTGTYDSGLGVWSVGNLTAGATTSLQVSASVDAGTSGATLFNHAWISASDLADPVVANNSSSVGITIASTDLQLTKDLDNASPNEGAVISYTITLTNAGPNDATGVAVTDVLPGGLTLFGSTASVGTYDGGTGLWDVGPLVNGGVETLTLTATVDGGTAGDFISNTAAITAADLADPALDNNTDNADLTVSSTDLQVTKTVDDSNPEVGGTVVYTITLTNAGPNVATGVTLRDVLPGGLTLGTASVSQGAYNEVDGLWTVGTVGVSGSATLMLPATVEAAAAGNNILNVASVESVDQADLDLSNNADDAVIDVPEEVATPIVSVRPVLGTPAGVLPGAAPNTVLHVELINLGAEADTLRSLTITNLTTAVGADQAMRDAEWAPLTVYGQRRGFGGTEPEQVLPAVVFVDGQADLPGFSWTIGVGDTLEVRVESGASLVSRDGAVLEAGLVDAGDIGVRQTVVTDGPLPLLSGHELVVDGFVAAQANLINVPSAPLAVGTQRNLAFAVDLPSNGYLADSLYGLTMANRGSAVAVDDILLMEAWADNGDGVFVAAEDIPLGVIVNSGELWQLTGMSAAIPPGGRRFFVTVDIPMDATPARDIRLELPTELGSAVIMASGNDGPLDLPLVNGGVLAISVADRLILTTEPIDPGVTRPGAGPVPLLTINLANTYAVEQRLQALTVMNGTVTEPSATPAQRDALIDQVILRLDGDNDGVLDDILTDPVLGSGAFVGGLATFSGLDLALTAGGMERIFVTAEVGIGTVADGDLLGALVNSQDEIWAPGSALVAGWPLNSGASWEVDGMIAAQVASANVPGRTLGPGDGPESALDLVIPSNGYQPDRLLGLAVENEGNAVDADLAQVRLWADQGDGMFDSATDLSLGVMNYFNGQWLSPVLSHDVPVGGAQFFVSVEVGMTPTDSATVRFKVPMDGIVMESTNSGPIDTNIPAGGTLVLSTSALASSIEFDTNATTVGQMGTLRMTVRNVGGETVTGIIPSLPVADGDATIALNAPAPASLDLIPDESNEFIWTYTATGPGTIVMTGSATGLGDISGLDHPSAPSPSSEHRVHSAVPRLDNYPTLNLPERVSRGQADLVPMTLTLINPGGNDVAAARLDSLRIRLAETPTGAPIVPADLIDRITLSEGSNIYVVQDILPTAGDEIDLLLSPPALVTGQEPLTLGLRIDLKSDSTLPSFVMFIDGSSSFNAVDQVSGLPVPVVMGDGAFPIVTKQANLVSPSGALAVTSEAGPDLTAQPGQMGVGLGGLTVHNDTVDPTASDIRVQALGFVPRDVDGNAISDASSLFDDLRVSSPSQLLFQGQPQYVDSLVVVLLSQSLDISVGANVELGLTGDLKFDAPTGPVFFDFLDTGQWIAEDSGDGQSVAVNVTPPTPVAGFTIVSPVTELEAEGIGLMSPSIGLGARDLPALELTLIHPAGPETATAAWDSLVLKLIDESRDPMNPSGLLDRIQVFENGTPIGSLVDPSAPDGSLAISLTASPLAPGDSLVLEVRLDVRADAPLTSFEIMADLPGIVTRDIVSGEKPGLTPQGTWPVWSGLASIMIPAEELVVAGTSLMPPQLAPQDSLEPVLRLVLQNSAPPASGSLAVAGITLEPADTDNDFALPGTAVAIIAASSGNEELGRQDAVGPEAANLTVWFEEPMILTAGGSKEVELLLGIRPAAPPGRLRLSLNASGVAVGPQGEPVGGIRILPAEGESLPLYTEIGNVGSVSLEKSYINFPNPFAAGGEQTTFAFFLNGPATVHLRLLTPQGDKVATLLDGESRPGGLHQDVTWTGQNGRGLVVRNGVYIAELVVEFHDGNRERVLRKVAVVR